MHAHFLGFSRTKRDSIKGSQCPHGELHTRRTLLWCIEVNLRNFVAAHRTGVPYANGDVQAVVRCTDYAEIGVAEAAVGEPISKRK